MDDDTIWKLFDPLFADLEDDEQPLLLAHYTSMTVLESILREDEIWFSNPLFMNDLEEVRFGILRGAELLKECPSVRAALKTEARHDEFCALLDHGIDQYEREHLFDTYVFCLSEHAPDDHDGLLSMWRGYGGNGKGAAIVFDARAIPVVESSPFVGDVPVDVEKLR